MRILGIDQSLSCTGLAVVESGQFTVLEALRPRTKGFERLEELSARCVELAADADVVALEAPTLSVRRSAATGALFGLFGVLTQDLWRAGKEPIVVNPTHRAMYAAGAGNANKDQVFSSVVRRYDDPRIVDNNIADAAVIAAMVARLLGEPLDCEGDLPAKNISVLTRIVAPDGVAGMVAGELQEDRAWNAVAARVDQPTFTALRALRGASPVYAHALLDFAQERGYRVYPNQTYRACARRLEQPTHTCGAKKCVTDWATPTEWGDTVLLKSLHSDGWALLAQIHSDHGLPAPIGGGLRAHLHTAAESHAGAK